MALLYPTNKFPYVPTGPLECVGSCANHGLLFEHVSTATPQAEICGKNDSVAGYVDFPPNSMLGVKHDYPIHTFYWFFPSQNGKKDAPLVVWLSGGPGASSVFALFTENGPCNFSKGATTPEANPWSWNKEYNLLYVDQPVQTGFSYDNATEGLLDLITGDITPGGSPAGNSSIRGVFASQNTSHTANTTETAAKQFWNFLQAWSDLPYYNASAPLALWTESYGGRYGPSFASYIVKQNGLIKTGSLSSSTHLNLRWLGIVNGCIDLPSQESSYPDFAYDKNPYHIKGINEAEYNGARKAYPDCKSKIETCLNTADHLDPEMNGNVSAVNEACKTASEFCQDKVEGPYMFARKRGYYDITHCYLDPFPGNEFISYLSTDKVRKALGVPVNYTDISNTVGLAFNITGDYARRDPRGGYLGNIATLLNAGVQVALVYGDRDFACNWLGGENASLSVAYGKSAEFAKAGYANLTVDGAVAGKVRQHELFSFARIYQSGHMVPAYQPEVSYRILQRVLQNKDVATGKVDTGSADTKGPHESTETLVPEVAPPVTCYYRALSITCAENQIDAVKNGTAKVVDGIVTSPVAPPGTCPVNGRSPYHDFSKGNTPNWDEWEAQADL